MFLKFLNTKIYYIVAFLFVSLSNVYLTTVTSFSPAYIGIFLAILSLLFFFNTTETIKSNNKTSGLFIFIFIILIILLLDCIITNNTSQVSYYFSYWFFNQFIFILGIYYFQRCNKDQIKKIVKGLFVISALVFLIDFFYRVNNSVSRYSGLLAFYNFKLNDLMFMDSNWPGFMSMLLFSTLIYLKDNKFLNNKHIIIFSFILVAQTLSRAALASCIAVLFFSKFMRFNKRVKYYIIVLGFPFVICLLILLLTKLNDGSYLTKLELLQGMLYYITHFDMHTLLWGNYPDACHDNLIFMHVWLGGHLYMTRYIDFGFITGFFEFTFLFLICLYTKFKALYIILPFLMAGMSFAPWYLPYMYCLLSLIYVLENNLYKVSTDNGTNKTFRIKKDLIQIFKIK